MYVVRLETELWFQNRMTTDTIGPVFQGKALKTEENEIRKKFRKYMIYVQRERCGRQYPMPLKSGFVLPSSCLLKIHEASVDEKND